MSLVAVSDTARRILGSIFRRPRETSLIVSNGDKRVTISGDTSPDEVRRIIERLLSEHDPQPKQGSAEQAPPANSSETPTAGKWEADD
ncbi:hypothetical protein OG244_19105 [Streptomyces brevispora]|uniref:hypothetical protein n=1 Tax=Streptomyces brevispora TaxID=887462 RepID=UPI002E3398A5|nr:hypothetical protein [Streptomyces brevispora]